MVTKKPTLGTSSKSKSKTAKAKVPTAKERRPKFKVGARPLPPPKRAIREREEATSSGKLPAPRVSKPVRAKKSSAKPDRGQTVALAIASSGLDRKALNVEIIDVRGRVDYADYIVVMSGRSDRQVAALARNIEDDLLKKEKIRCAGIEGLPQGAWVLMDFGDVIVHVFHEDTRGYYDIEALWMDAARVPIDD